MFTAAAVLVRILVNPLSNVFQKQLIERRISHASVNFLTYLLLSLCSVFYATQIDWSQLPTLFWFFALLIGVLTALGNKFLLLALQHGELSVLGPINAYKSVVSMVGAFLLFGELPGPPGCLGMGLIIWGSYVVLDTTHEKFSWRILQRSDIQYRLLAMILTAIEAVFIKKTILLSSPAIALTTWCWFGALFTLPLLIFDKESNVTEQFHTTTRESGKLLVMVLCVGLMQLSTNYVFSVLPVAYALALFQLSAIVSVFFGSHFFDEGHLLKKLLGAGVMVTGSIIIIMSV